MIGGKRLENGVVKVSEWNGQFRVTLPKCVADSVGICKGSVLHFTAYPGGLIRVEKVNG